MIDNLLWDELEVVKSFYKDAKARIAEKASKESAQLAGINDEEIIEHIVTHPHGALKYKQLALRAVINELNAICEFSLQNAWITKSKHFDLPSGDLIFTASRGQIEKALKSSYEIRVDSWPHWPEVLKIKEISEGFKHRQRMMPFPIDLQNNGPVWRARRLFDPNNEKDFAEYELNLEEVDKFIEAIEELFRWLEGHDLSQ